MPPLLGLLDPLAGCCPENQNRPTISEISALCLVWTRTRLTCSRKRELRDWRAALL